MDREEMLQGIGYCGLVCLYCTGCVSCRDKDQGIETQEIPCYHKRCAISKKLNGCWECDCFPCTDGTMFQNIRVNTFVKFIKEEGIETFLRCITNNQRNGIIYGADNDYDKVATEDEIYQLLSMGR